MSKSRPQRLTPQHRTFIKHYMSGKTAAESARLAGYSNHTARESASRLLRIPKIKKEIERREKSIMEKTDLTVEFWIKNMMEVIESCTEKEDNSVKLKALDLTGKYLNLFTTNVKVDGTVKVESIEQYLKRCEDEKRGIIEGEKLKLIE